jgi:hypothetical protein
MRSPDMLLRTTSRLPDVVSARQRGIHMDMRRSTQLREITELSRQMLEKAQNREWDRVAELEARRRELVILCFRIPTRRQEAAAVAASIQEILRLNHAVTELGRDCKERLSRELHAHKVGRAASEAYLNCTR